MHVHGTLEGSLSFSGIAYKLSYCFQGHFVMFMLCDIENSKYTFKEIKEAILKTGEELGMEIWVQKKEIFDNMHNV